MSPRHALSPLPAVGSNPFRWGWCCRPAPRLRPTDPKGSVGTWRDLIAAAVVVRSMLGVSPSAYEQACNIMGPENAATVMACVLERAGHINSAGGYLRDLTRPPREENLASVRC